MEIDNVLELVRRGRRQIIFHGPPGTGKTHLARQVAASLLGCDAGRVQHGDVAGFLRERQYSRLPDLVASGQTALNRVRDLGGVWDMVQFHPSYNYEDFVRGISPEPPAGGGIPAFRAENRIFGSLAELSASSDAPVVLVVDEVNRGDLSKVLGELLFALEYRNEAVRCPYAVGGSSTLMVGKEFYLLATMNSADRSIALIDYAIRRRFDFVELRPDRQVLTAYLSEVGLSPYAERITSVFDAISVLFESAQDQAVGHTYFMGKDTDDIARRIVFQVLPLLAEYQKEGILDPNTTIPIRDWPGASGLPLTHPKPFLLAGEVKAWLDGGRTE